MLNSKLRVFSLAWLAALALAVSGVSASAAVRKPAAPAKVSKSAKPVRAAAAPTARAKARPAAVRRPVAVRAEAPAKPSFGQLYGLHESDDPLDLRSSVAFVMDQDTNEILLSKNPDAVLPIASITKLMTAMVVTEARLSMDETLTISDDDVDTEKGTRSRLVVGTQLTRGEMLHLALMSSENRAAHALGRHYPGGLQAFVLAMNAKARMLGMHDTRYVEPTGLSSSNQSSARDLATLVKAAYQVSLIRELSTSPEYQVSLGRRQLQFHTTNRLVKSPEWDIGLQKTGYISEAGQCLVMQARLAGRKLIMVLLDSAGKYSRIGDAERIRRWLTGAPDQVSAQPVAAGRSAG
ncbi:D-alanyl-D-alanine endopeptidase [Ideonella sp. 4Y11]|uniref:D-alanyl-D-alanine endopeptidase n=1 Tax=Ideonella aquatica TaxID=2824119 RepID=A0A940YKW1_9BURK|nr:D-alanyl-D-alanine endopeptidase [Ideonella aquatica]MBQ0959719.1 D-alanyl-D-alanine endopeptidase [Ideonella aquatica]